MPRFRQRAPRRAFLAICVLVLHLVGRRALAAEMFVSVSGKDLNNGTLEAPFATIPHALSQAADGDTVNLRSGTYAGGIDLRKPVTLQAYSGEKVSIVAPANDPNVVHAIYVLAPNVTLRGLEIVGGNWFGVKFDFANGIVDSCIIHDTGHSAIKIVAGVDYITVRNSELYRTGVTASYEANGIGAVNSDYLTVQDSYIHDMEGVAAYSKGGSRFTVYERNRVRNTGMGLLLGQYTDFNLFDPQQDPDYYENLDGIARNNVAINTTGASLAAYASLNARFFNNTVVDGASTSQAAVLISSGGSDDVIRPNTGLRIRNNIVVVQGGSQFPAVAVRAASVNGIAELDNNIYYTGSGNGPSFWNENDPSALFYGDFSGWKSKFGLDSSSRVADPLLAEDKHHLTAGSPAIDNGAVLPDVTDDLDGRLRSSSRDVGAVEYQAGDNNPVPTGVPPSSPKTPRVVLQPPSRLTVIDLSSTTVRLEWIDNSSSETGFQVQQGRGRGKFHKSIQTSADVRTATMSGLRPRTHYRFKVRALGEATVSQFSNVVKVRVRR